MEAITKKNFLKNAKIKAQQKHYNKLIIPQEELYQNNSKQIYEILVSQYATIMVEDTFPVFEDSHKKYPLPIAYACFKFATDIHNYDEALKILHRNMQKQYLIHNHIISFNIALLYKFKADLRKYLFYLQILLKQQPSFEDGVYQYCSALIQSNRKQEAIKILTRHLQEGQLTNSERIQSLYIYLINKTETQQHRKTLIKIFHKKNISPVVSYNLGLYFFKLKNYYKAVEIFIALKQALEIHDYLQSSYYKHLSIKVETNLSYLRKLQYFPTQPQSSLNENYSLKASTSQNFRKHNYLHKRNLNSIKQQSTKRTNKRKREKSHKILRQKVPNELQQLNKKLNETKSANKKKLQYLIHKEQQIKTFFKRVLINKKQNNIQFKILNPNILIDYAKKQLSQNKNKKFDTFEKEFQEKKQLHRINYHHDQLKSIINQYFSQHLQDNSNKQPTKNIIKLNNNSKDNEKQVKLVQQQKNKHNNTNEIKDNNNRNSNKSQLHKKSYNNIIKNKTVQKNSFNEQIVISRSQIEQKLHKKSLQNQQVYPLSIFQQQLAIGSSLELKNQHQQANKHYIKMYKQFKKGKQKQQILLKIAKSFENMDNFVDAQKTYKKCCKYNNSKAFFNLGLLEINKLARIDQGVQNLQKANCIKRFDTQIQIKLVYGYSLKQSSFDKAFSLATSILKRKPQSLQTLLMTVNILQKKGKIKQALQIAHAIDNFKQSLEMKYYLGLLYLNDSNVEMAYKYFRGALKIKSDHIPSLIEVATILSETNVQQAINILNKVIEQEKDNKLALTRLGKIYQSIKNDYDSAMKTYKKSLEVQKDYESYIKIGDVMMMKKSYIQAYLNYKQALSLRDTSEVHSKLALVFTFQKQFKNAYENYQQALSLIDNNNYPQKKIILQEMGQVALLSKDYQNAILALTQIFQVQETRNICIKLGDAYYGKGEYDQALTKYEIALKINTAYNNEQILQKIALCFDRKQQYHASKQIYEKIISDNPSNINCINNLGNILLIMGNTNQAFYWFQTMLAKIPLNTEKRLMVADIYATVGDWSKVQNHLLFCYKIKEDNIKVIERLINLYKQKRQLKLVQKFQKKLALIKGNRK